MIKLNKNWSIEHHSQGGYNLIRTTYGENKKGQQTTSTRSYFYPKLKMIASRFIEENFNNGAETINQAISELKIMVVKLTAELEKQEQVKTAQGRTVVTCETKHSEYNRELEVERG